MLIGNAYTPYLRAICVRDAHARYSYALFTERYSYAIFVSDIYMWDLFMGAPDNFPSASTRPPTQARTPQTHTHTHTHIHTYYIYIYIHTCICMCVPIYVHICAYLLMCISARTWPYLATYMISICYDYDKIAGSL